MKQVKNKKEKKPAGDFTPANYLYINGETFLLRRVRGGIDVQAETREFYQAQLNALRRGVDELRDEITGRVVSDVNDDFARQNEKILNYLSRFTVTVPDELLNRVIIYSTGRASFQYCRPAIYKPVEFYGPAGRFRDNNDELFNDDRFSNYGVDVELIVTTKPLTAFPVIVCFDDKKEAVYLRYGLTFHSMSYPAFCIGGRENYAAFSELSGPELSEQISRVNLFSLGSHKIFETDEAGNRTGEIFSLKNYLRPENILTVNKKGVNAWTA